SGIRAEQAACHSSLGSVDRRVFRRFLREHALSIEQAQDLDLTDFRCRYLVVDDIWIPLAETLLIEMYQPVWNTIVPGFGNHAPGKGRHKQQRSAWDALHPGRPWAAKLQDHPKTRDHIKEEVRQSLRDQ
ncbi:MAG: Eco29kI family restriction endonuclease, partial [Roseiflexus sp.]|nr:Eco29kI family restriction endonuclease [Roseiflexus sp.]